MESILSLDTNGKSRGLVPGWNHSFNLTASSVLDVGLLTVLHSLEIGEDFSVTNLYGPYENRHPFWGSTARMDPLLIFSFIIWK